MNTRPSATPTPERQSTIFTHADLMVWLMQLDREQPGRYQLRSEFFALRSLSETVRDGQHYQAPANEFYTFNGRVIWQTTSDAARQWLNAGGTGHPVPGTHRYELIDSMAAKVIQFPKPAPAPAADEWKQTRTPGLFLKVERNDLVVTFRYHATWQSFDIRTGVPVDASDMGNFPADIEAVIKTRVAMLPPPHRRQKTEEAAREAPQTASEIQPPQEATAPIVSADASHVNTEKEDPMLDLSNPAAVATYRTTAMNMSKSIGIPDMESRRTTMRHDHLVIEKAYRRAEVDAEEAKRRLADVKSALKDRADELLNVVAEIKLDGVKPKYPNPSSLATAVKAALKTYAPYTATLTDLKGAEAALKAAANDDKPAIEATIAARREELIAREADLTEALTTETVIENALRYTSVDSKNAAAITLRRTDAEYLAIEKEVGATKQALYVAEMALGDAKAEQRAMAREWDMLGKEHDLAVARINAFTGLDAPAPTGPAPVSTPAAASAAVA